MPRRTSLPRALSVRKFAVPPVIVILLFREYLYNLSTPTKGSLNTVRCYARMTWLLLVVLTWDLETADRALQTSIVHSPSCQRTRLPNDEGSSIPSLDYAHNPQALVAHQYTSHWPGDTHLRQHDCAHML